MSMQQSGAGSEAGAVATRAAEETKGVASTAMEGTREVASEAAGQVSTVVGSAKDQIHVLVDDTRTQVQQQAETQASRAAEGLRNLSQQFGALADGRTSEAPQLQQYLSSAQQRLSDVATRVETRGPQGLMEDLTSFARRKPGMFLLAAAGAGFAAGRLLRSGALSSSGGDGGQSRSTDTGMYMPSTAGIGAMPAPDPIGAGIGAGGGAGLAEPGFQGRTP
jgi:hypothetical protein